MKKVFFVVSCVDKNEKRKGLLCLFFCLCFLCFWVVFFFEQNRKWSVFILRYTNSITSIRARIGNAPSTYLRGHFSSSSANVVAVVFVLEKTIYY